ncbi:MAG: hypothetical protein CMI79_03020 [Candidatus Pelagibacter sp.]|nr:hypothetical protein [Candidatus Pelagibacter sp.]|tara:strand:- start:685 stop:1053 length:369 start_codon:yes stop_codon:yes gene_type:complete
MRNDKIRRFRPRSNKYRSRRPGNGVKNNGIIHQVNNHRNGLSRNNINKNPHNLERIIEKYKNLAKEALTSGDKILHENFLQHSDHFSRILSEVVAAKSKNNLDNKQEDAEQKNNIVKEQTNS